jgi:hypothetical protein
MGTLRQWPSRYSVLYTFNLPDCATKAFYCASSTHNQRFLDAHSEYCNSGHKANRQGLYEPRSAKCTGSVLNRQCWWVAVGEENVKQNTGCFKTSLTTLKAYTFIQRISTVF